MNINKHFYISLLILFGLIRQGALAQESDDMNKANLAGTITFDVLSELREITGPRYDDGFFRMISPETEVIHLWHKGYSESCSCNTVVGYVNENSLISVSFLRLSKDHMRIVVREKLYGSMEILCDQTFQGERLQIDGFNKLVYRFELPKGLAILIADYTDLVGLRYKDILLMNMDKFTPTSR